jgi:hypothetical protein
MAFGLLGHLGMTVNAKKLAPIKPFRGGLDHASYPNMEDKSAKEKQMKNRAV